MKKITTILYCLIVLSACVKDKPQNAIQPVLQLSSSKKVFVINEGGFGNNQASVSLYDPATGQVIEDFYKTINNANAGDVAQSLSFVNGNYYLVVNNSDKIIVCDKQFKKTGQISGLGSPRYILPITNKKAYVSDLSSNALNIIDLNTNTKTSVIPCAGWTEKMVLIYNRAFVTNLRKNFVYVINTLGDLMADSIAVGINAGNILIDKNDKIWVMSSGDQTNSVPAKLHRINPLNNNIELSLVFSNGEAPNNLCSNKTKDTLYFINKGICRFPITGSALPQNAFVPGNNRNYYGLGFNADDFTLYAADALDYVQRSNVYIFDRNGNQLSFFKAGIISNGFYFE